MKGVVKPEEIFMKIKSTYAGAIEIEELKKKSKRYYS